MQAKPCRDEERARFRADAAYDAFERRLRSARGLHGARACADLHVNLLFAYVLIVKLHVVSHFIMRGEVIWAAPRL